MARKDERLIREIRWKFGRRTGACHAGSILRKWTGRGEPFPVPRLNRMPCGGARETKVGDRQGGEPWREGSRSIAALLMDLGWAGGKPLRFYS